MPGSRLAPRSVVDRSDPIHSCSHSHRKRKGAYLPVVQHHAYIDNSAHYHNSLQRNSGKSYSDVEGRLLPLRCAQNHIPAMKEGIVMSGKTCMVWLIANLS